MTTNQEKLSAALAIYAGRAIAVEIGLKGELRLTPKEERRIAAHVRRALDVPGDVEIVVEIASDDLAVGFVGFYRDGIALTVEEVGPRPAAYPTRMVARS